MGNLCIQSHFREADTTGAVIFGDKDASLLKRLNEIQQFEHTFPFYRLRIDQYEGRIKRFVNKEDNNTVTMRQLRYSFQEDALWIGLQDESSVLSRLFKEPELRSDEEPEKLDVIKLICLGLMLCGGTDELKARVFYDVLQDNMQQKISSSDKDFKTTFAIVINLFCYMIPRMYREEAKKPQMNSHYPEPDLKN